MEYDGPGHLPGCHSTLGDHATMIPRKSLLSTLLLTTILAWLPVTGCSSMGLSEPTPTQIVYPTIRPPKPTRTPTSTPTATAHADGYPHHHTHPTLPPPQDDFSQARLYSFGPLPGWDFSFTLLLPEEIKGDYNAVVGDPPKPFTCRPLTEYAHPDRLYCAGRIPKVDQDLEFKVIEKSTGQVVFKGYRVQPPPLKTK